MLDRMLKRLQCPEEGIRQSVPCSDDIDTKRGLLHFLKRAHGFSLKRDCIAFVAFSGDQICVWKRHLEGLRQQSDQLTVVNTEGA